MRFLKNNIWTVLLVLTGSATWSLTMVKSGLTYVYGMGFWGPNGHDGIWHVALINSLAQGSLEMPVYAGESLKNYHIGFDLLLAIIHKITQVPSNVLYFQIVPPVTAAAIGILSYLFVLRLTQSKKSAFWATFFVYFGGSFGPVVSLFRGGQITGESMFWAQQAISTLINPPYAISLVVILIMTLTILKYEKKRTLSLVLLLSFLTALVAQIKVYAGILVLGALLVVGIYDLVFRKKFGYLAIFVLSLTLSLLLFLPLNRGSTSLVVFQPFWFLETMMALSDRLGWPRFYEAMTNYRLAGNWVKGPAAYFVAFVIFWVGNMGTRIVKDVEIVTWFKNWKKLENIQVFQAAIIIGGGVAPMLFLQEGTPWNTIQFLYYSLFFSGLLAGVAFARLLERKSVAVKRAIVIVLLLLTLPTTYGTLKHYLPSRPPAKLVREEAEALNFLAKQDRGTVLTYPYDAYKAAQAVTNPPRPLYLYESTAYVAAFSKKPVFLEDEVNLNITAYNWKERRKKTEEWLVTLNQEEAYSFLRQNNIRYIYWLKGQRARLGETQLGISRLFENKMVDIYQVD